MNLIFCGMKSWGLQTTSHKAKILFSRNSFTIYIRLCWNVKKSIFKSMVYAWKLNVAVSTFFHFMLIHKYKALPG